MSVLLWKLMLANQRSRKGNASPEACCVQSLINYSGWTSELGGSWPTTVQYATLWASTFVKLSWRCPIRNRCRVYVTVGCPSVRPSVCLSRQSTSAACRSHRILISLISRFSFLSLLISPTSHFSFLLLPVHCYLRRNIWNTDRWGCSFVKRIRL